MIEEQNYIQDNGKKLTCGVLIENDKGEILIGHCTGKQDLLAWDIPKGCMDDGESPREAAIREVREEIGIDLSNETLVDLGKYSYNAKKDIWLFWVKKNINPETLECKSYFVDRWGREQPEINGYKTTPKTELHDCYLPLQKVIPKAFEYLEKLGV